MKSYVIVKVILELQDYLLKNLFYLYSDHNLIL